MLSTRLQDHKIRRIQTWVNSIKPPGNADIDAYLPESQDSLHSSDAPKVRRKRPRDLHDSSPQDLPCPDEVELQLPFGLHSSKRRKIAKPVLGSADAGSKSSLDGYIPALQPIPTPQSPIFKLPSRSKRPIKCSNDLHQLEKPVRVQLGIESPLPDDVATLFTQIRGFSHDHYHIVPEEISQQVAQLDNRTQLPPHNILKSNSAQASSIIAKLELLQLHHIYRSSNASADMGRHESAWNNLVNSPLLQLAFEPQSTLYDKDNCQEHIAVRVEPVMSAVIASDSLPRMRNSIIKNKAFGHASSSGIHLSSSARNPFSQPSFLDQLLQINTGKSQTDNPNTSERRKVDSVVVLDIPQQLPLGKAIFQLIADLRVYGGAGRHVNQTEYTAISDSPIGLSIDSKTVTTTRDPLLQLSIWVAAWHRRMYYLRAWKSFRANEDDSDSGDLGGAGGDNITEQSRFPIKLVSVPLIIIMEHEWSIYFACDKTTSITLYGPFSLGSTNNIVSLYALISSLRAIKVWIETTFYQGLKHWFLDEAESTNPGQ